MFHNDNFLNRLLGDIKSLNIVVKYAFVFCLLSVLLIELILKNWEAPNEEFYRAGDIWLKLCYSITASSIFFFINQHLPKESKKRKMKLVIDFKIREINHNVNCLIRALRVNALEQNKTFSQNEVEELLSKIDYDEAFVSLISFTELQNWGEFLNVFTLKTINSVEYLIDLHEVVSSNVLEILSEFTKPLTTLKSPFWALLNQTGLEVLAEPLTLVIGINKKLWATLE